MLNNINAVLAGLLLLGGLSANGQSNVFPASGNVGIGTSTPAKKLDVIGAVKSNELNFPLTQYNFELGPRTQLSPMSIKLFDDYASQRSGGVIPGNNRYGTLLAIYGRSSHWQSDIYFGSTDRKMYFRTGVFRTHQSDNGEGNFDNWRTILDSHSDVKSNGKLLLTGSGNHFIENGNVGIGTTSPKAKLAVEGNILAKEIKVTNNIAVPDYVFELDYHLSSLSDVEAYVKEHKHLPEIPSAKDIERDGLDLGEMNLLLLKKVEELTLHLIEKEKEIGKHREKIGNLEGEIESIKEQLVLEDNRR
ncbi:hypothetical protein [Sphingobacterium haloxyli]|uniref:Uncharacterized protein n=1 Tax=Sphingobacterium haloxyli TaxID=2100533 RepID=A0A2S9IWS3_9SPHI|nr:hypothetical protein [Sphingobacterium haloxyli]PRD44972.1 hypothetical protein C5745_18905 [Sphingobacterium haloxyli]